MTEATSSQALCVFVLPPRDRLVGRMSSPSPRSAELELETQSKVDNMTSSEFAKYMLVQNRRATTAKQRQMAENYPIWKCLLKQKLEKLDEQAFRKRLVYVSSRVGGRD